MIVASEVDYSGRADRPDRLSFDDVAFTAAAALHVHIVGRGRYEIIWDMGQNIGSIDTRAGEHAPFVGNVPIDAFGEIPVISEVDCLVGEVVKAGDIVRLAVRFESA